MIEPYYDEGGIQIYLGKCEDVLPQITDIKCVVTSPPYNTLGDRVPKEGTNLMKNNKWLAKVNEHGYDDSLPEDVYLEQQQQVAALLAASAVPGASYFYNHKVRYRDGEVLHPLEICRTFEDWSVRQEIIWDRTIAMAFNAKMFAPSDERIYWMVKPGAKYTWNQEAAKWMNIWRISPLQSDGGHHPCPYPIEIPNRCILATTSPGDLVLDPYLGSGTTLRAAKDLGRRGIGIETRSDFADIAIERLKQESIFEIREREVGVQEEMF